MRRTFQILIALGSVLFLVFAIVGTTRAADEPQIVRVTLKDYQIELSQFTVAPGKAVEFLVANEGTMPHRFIVEPYRGANAARVADAPVIAIGTARTIQETFTPGIYRVTCDRWDHAERGMVNAFAVQAPTPKTFPVRMDFGIPLLGLVLGSAYILWDSLGLRLTRTANE